MKRTALVCVAALLPLSVLASQTPARGPQKVTLEQKLRQTEAKMSKLAANHDKVMAQMKRIGDQIDALTKALHELRLKLESKAGP